MANGRDPDRPQSVGADPDQEHAPITDPLIRAFMESTGLADSLFQITGQPRYVERASVGAPGTAGQFFPTRDSLTIVPVRGEGAKGEMEAVLAHELAHRLASYGLDPAVGRLKESVIYGPDVPGRLGDADTERGRPWRASHPIEEAFAQNFEQAVGTMRKAGQSDRPLAVMDSIVGERVEEGRESFPDFLRFLMQRDPFADTELARKVRNRRLERVRETATAARDATGIKQE